MRGILAALTLAAVTSACDGSWFSLPVARDAGLDAKADALGPLPVIFSEGEPAGAEGAGPADVFYSLNR